MTTPSYPLPPSTDVLNQDPNISSSMGLHHGTSPTTFAGGEPSGTLDFDLEAFLQSQNRRFVAALAPSLAYMVVVLLSGLAGNSLVLVIYHRRFKPSVTRTYILAMSGVDLLTNVLSLPADMAEVGLHNTFRHCWLCKGFRTVKSFLGFLSAFILVAVALDRQRAICRPQASTATPRHARHMLIVVSALALAFTLPYSVLTGPRSVPYPPGVAPSNVTGLECSVQDAYAESLFLFIYNMLTGLLLLLCIALMLGSYVRVARQLWLHRKNTAIIMADSQGPACRGDGTRKGSALPPSHTYTFEESSSHSATRSMSLASRGGSARGDNTRPAVKDVELVSTGTPLQGDTHKAASGAAETAVSDAENLNEGGSPNSGDFADGVVSPGTVTSEAADLGSTLTSGVDNTDCGNHSVSLSGPTSCHATDHKVDDITSGDPRKQRGQTSSSRARAVLSRIRRTASDARSFIGRSRKSLPGPRSRRGPGGSAVKKIPTRTTLMMFVLTVVFIVNYLPYLLLVSVRSRLGMEVLVERLGLNGYHIGLRSYFINSAVNSLVYSFCSARFRQECQRLFHCQGK